MKNFLKEYWLVILLSMLVGIFAGIWTNFIESGTIVELPMQAGKFITLDNLKLSMYITRIINNNDKITVCVIQQRPIDFIFFENCVWVENIKEVMDNQKGYITNTCVYNRVME